MKNKEPRILVWDIETSPMISYNWSAYESNALEIIEEPQILCFAYKWLGDKSVTVIGQCDLAGYKAGRNDDRKLVALIHQLFDQADIVVAHNGDSFDQKTAQSRMMAHGMKPPSPYKQIDTKKVAKKYGRFSRNKLDDLSKQFGFGRKMENEGWALWKKVLGGDKKAWETMKKYNKIDVELEEKLYLHLRPWIQNHPSISVLTDRPDSCVKCGSSNMRTGGFFATKVGRKKRYQCLDCGGWCHGRVNVQQLSNLTD